MVYYCQDCGSILDPQFVKLKDVGDGYLCPVNVCGGTMVEIDELMIEPIRLLNEKGYRTTYCCSGHIHKFGNPYICFKSSMPLTTPEGWYRDKNCIRYDLAGNKFTIGRFTIGRMKEIARAMESLYKWVILLDDKATIMQKEVVTLHNLGEFFHENI